MLKVLSLVVIFLNLLDNYTTFRFLNATSGNLIIVEGNPAVSTLMHAFGVRTSLGLEMAGMTLVAVFLASTDRMARPFKMWTLAALIVLPLWAVLNNVEIALSFHLPLL
jgi:hypothetical protein